MPIAGVCPACGVGHGDNPCPRGGSNIKREANPGASRDGEATGSIFPHNQPTVTDKGYDHSTAIFETELNIKAEDIAHTLLASLEKSGRKNGNARFSPGIAMAGAKLELLDLIVPMDSSTNERLLINTVKILLKAGYVRPDAEIPANR